MAKTETKPAAKTVANENVNGKTDNSAPVVDMPKSDATKADDKKADEPAVPTAPVVELTSDKLTELEGKYAEAKANARKIGIEKPDSKEEEDAWQASYVIKKQIDAEKLALVQEQKNRQVVEKRNAIKSDFDKLFEAHEAAIASRGNDAMSLEDKQKVSNDFQALYDKYLNQLTGGIAAPRVAKEGGDKTASTGTRGATTAAIRAIIAPMFAGGKTGAEVRKSVISEHGFNDGTANAVILAYEKELGLK